MFMLLNARRSGDLPAAAESLLHEKKRGHSSDFNIALTLVLLISHFTLALTPILPNDISSFLQPLLATGCRF
ncbi:hypothetical protein ABEX25_17830 [Paenibacillus thiaminolyticus]|uniref:hypothetical protein n=1 Tax=Paenibacillus thiaminolyticus TaxID=49283 RepID=UPI003D298509